MHIVFVASAASKNVNEKIKTQTSSPPFVGGYMVTIFFLLGRWISGNYFLSNCVTNTGNNTSTLFTYLILLKVCRVVHVTFDWFFVAHFGPPVLNFLVNCFRVIQVASAFRDIKTCHMMVKQNVYQYEY